MGLEPFTVTVPEVVLADLRHRLERTRWPDEIADAGWRYGIPASFMQAVAAHWRDVFDWRDQERRINRFANYRITMGGIGIHVIYERGRGPQPLPLLLTHGWPSSFVEMLDLIPLLTDPAAHGGDPADAFDVIVPSIPGYGFSDHPNQPGFTYQHIADLWIQLMDALGYPRFLAHSYDVGASIMGLLLRRHPKRVIAYHTTEPGNPAPYLGPGAPPLSPDEQTFKAYQAMWQAEESGYMVLQTTRPQTLSYGLSDSPTGLAAWILEKWHAWTDPPNGDLLRCFTLDQLLTNVTLYWVTDTISAANRLYYERAHAPTPMGLSETIDVPLGVTLTTQRIERVPREYAGRVFRDIRRWTEFPSGGHFITLEEPRLVADALRTFFRAFRS